mgnify:CR=1 FL=1
MMNTETVEKETKDTLEQATFTFTARNIEDPNRLATFTLQNGSVAMLLGDALVEQVESAMEALDEEQRTQIRTWLQPAATGAVQAAIKPIPVNDFNADLSADGDFHTTAWVRAGGLRLAPVRISWDQVDNPQGAAAFVQELERRQENMSAEKTGTGPFDYWATWLLFAGVAILTPLILWRYLSGRKEAES